MPHDLTLITTIAASLALAFVLGFIAARLKLPPLLGYLVAGVMIGPATPGFVADLSLSSQLAEIGVMLLMFGVGLHFSVKDLLAVRKIALPGAILQIAAATGLGWWVASTWGWSFSEGLVFGLSLSVASTVVLLKALEQQNLLKSINGQIAVGWLIVEDLVMVLVLVLLPSLAGLLSNQSGAEFDASMLLTLLTHHPGQNRHLRRLNAHRRATLLPLAAMASRQNRLTRTLHPLRHQRRRRHRLRLRQLIWRLLRPRRIFRRHGHARIAPQPPRRRRLAAPA